jgi:hypothetical protein
MLSRTEYLAKELSRHGGLAAAAEVMKRPGPCIANPKSSVIDTGAKNHTKFQSRGGQILESCTLFDWTSKSEVPLNLGLRARLAGVGARHQGTEGFCRQVQQQRCHRDCREQSWSVIACGRSKGNGGDNQGLEDGEREGARGKEAWERFYPFLVACKGRPPEVVWNRFSCRWF